MVPCLVWSLMLFGFSYPNQLLGTLENVTTMYQNELKDQFLITSIYRSCHEALQFHYICGQVHTLLFIGTSCQTGHQVWMLYVFLINSLFSWLLLTYHDYVQRVFGNKIPQDSILKFSGYCTFPILPICLHSKAQY